MKIAVIGAGSWGTALANMLAKTGRSVTLWVHEPRLAAEIRERSENTWFLPGVPLHPSLELTTDYGQALDKAGFSLCAVPTQFFRQSLRAMREQLGHKPIVVCANKGIEVERLCTISEMVEQELAGLDPVFAMLSGPSFAKEVCQEAPTAVALGCADKKVGKELQRALSTDYFRIYTTTDVRGVELGGAVKNIIAIAAGIADGLGFGNNTRAALITRGLAEMTRLGKAMGAHTGAFMGLAGMGDLVLTCTGDLSRNRQVGLKLGKGQKLAQILAETNSVAEGVKTTQAVFELGRQRGIELPITEQVHAVLYEDKDPRQAVRDLMTRTLKDE
jgi:glycerol-3-phosphate dehydrogenase (NAD(P)+)